MRRAIGKRQYVDVYNAAYARKRNIDKFVRTLLKAFEAQPLSNARVPQYLQTMIQTQSIAENTFITIPTRSLRLSKFIERRAAQCISRHVLHYLYKPGGWFTKKIVPFVSYSSDETSNCQTDTN